LPIINEFLLIFENLQITKRIDQKYTDVELLETGICISSKILNIIPPEVYFAIGNDFSNPEISSIFRHKDNEIIFNED
jgi:hypothetical protein